MITVKAFIEGGDIAVGETRPFFSVYIDLEDDRLNYGIIGSGSSPEEAAEDFLIGYEEMKEYFAECEEPFEEAFFIFVKDFDDPQPLNLPDHIVQNQCKYKPAPQVARSIHCKSSYHSYPVG
jgi:hypothetical protein